MPQQYNAQEEGIRSLIAASGRRITRHRRCEAGRRVYEVGRRVCVRQRWHRQDRARQLRSVWSPATCPVLRQPCVGSGRRSPPRLCVYSASGQALHACVGGDCGKEYPKAAFSPSQWKKGRDNRVSAACAHAKSPKDISAPTSAQLFGACLRIAHPRRQSDTWAERGAAEEAAAREAEAAAREEEAARAAFAQPAGWKYSYESGDDTVNHRYTFALREDGTYSLRSDHTAMLAGICGVTPRKAPGRLTRTA